MSDAYSSTSDYSDDEFEVYAISQSMPTAPPEDSSHEQKSHWIYCMLSYPIYAACGYQSFNSSSDAFQRLLKSTLETFSMITAAKGYSEAVEHLMRKTVWMVNGEYNSDD